MDTLLVFIGILVFASGLVVGYVYGWRDGSTRGWIVAMQEVRRLIARTKGAA